MMHNVLRLLFALVLLCAGNVSSAAENAALSSPPDPFAVAFFDDNAAQPRMGGIAADQLPPQARETLQLIKQGGPFPYSKDGTVFGNRERRLPQHERGYYREYTVKTPGSRDRGARRIVAGAGGEFYYTADHYRTFRRIRE
ncbi:MAG: hypothetical protein IDH49_00105 [Gammaproteobacteria bacterium]|nr:hypothetical protein [Gammaproteobacteria bacterium]